MVARMILWCYTGRYLVLWTDRTDAVRPTLETMLQAGRGGEKLPIQATTMEFTRPADVHLAMWLLADKYEMQDLASDAQASLAVSMVSNLGAFWSLLAQLGGLPDHIARGLENSMVTHARARAQHYLSDDRFKTVIEDHPKMAWEIVKVNESTQKIVKW